jgi:hypothetical protein
MENLNKNQLVLLVLLITFVTSIATGIMTVSLLQQAPVEVTRTIENVVEKTIQQVTPAAVSNIIAPQQSSQTTTVVVGEDDAVTASIGKNLQSIVRVDETDVNGYVSFYGLGVVMGKNGIIATDNKGVASDSIYTAKFSDGAEWKLVPLNATSTADVSLFFKVNLPPKTTYAFSPATAASVDLQLGQTVIGIGGETNNATAVGRVVSLDMKSSTIGTTTTKYIWAIETDTSFRNILDGSSFFDLSGNLVGLKLSQTNDGVFTPISLISKELNLVNK